MKARELIVFAGQSNMMGASVYPPKSPIRCTDAYEYKHKSRLLGGERGEFVAASYPVGEFSYRDPDYAYAEGRTDALGKSTVDTYVENTWFCPAMSNLADDEAKTEHPFAFFSESTARHGVTLAPFLAEEWEALGRRMAYAHIAKGCVHIEHYFSDEMREEYLRLAALHNATHPVKVRESMTLDDMRRGAAAYFDRKCLDFFRDAEERFADEDTSHRILIWLQGEAEVGTEMEEYLLKLRVLKAHALSLGFTHFCLVRIDFFGTSSIYKMMQAAEVLAKTERDAYLLTRAASFLTYPGQEEEGWFLSPPTEEYRECRDSCFGFRNNHINEKGFRLIAHRAAPNLARILRGETPVLERENILPILKEYGDGKNH